VASDGKKNKTFKRQPEKANQAKKRKGNEAQAIRSEIIR
jgi:hypothetical protein